MPFRRANESEETYRLKWAAWEWLFSVAGCRAIGLEVSLEGPGGRIVDVAGVGPDRTLYVVEVKVSRADFRRDDHDAEDEARLYDREPALHRMAEVARAVAEHLPDDHQATMDAALAERRIARHSARIDTFSTKFHDPAYVRIADFNYLMAPKRLVRRTEVPPLWGLLDPTPQTVIDAPRTRAQRSASVLSDVLRAIARANTRDMMRAQGVRWKHGPPVFPRNDSAEA